MSEPETRSVIHAVIPSMAGWRTYGRAWSNLLLFGLTLLAGTWIVHQTEYVLEYGRHVSSVMATGPHHLYMGPLGTMLAGAGITALALLRVALQVTQRRLRRLNGHIPARLAHVLAVPLPPLPVRVVGSTALVLAVGQMGLYLVQENLESLAALGTLPGLAVLLAPQHLTVLPLHLLAGLVGSILLWTASSWLQRSRHTLQLARVLAGVASTKGKSVRHAASTERYLPNLRLLAGDLGLRSPPLSV
ncbi:MAG TPA: hypothetical protein VF221_22500 [Chloroflexota bacterium]